MPAKTFTYADMAFLSEGLRFKNLAPTLVEKTASSLFDSPNFLMTSHSNLKTFGFKISSLNDLSLSNEKFLNKGY